MNARGISGARNEKPGDLITAVERRNDKDIN